MDIITRQKLIVLIQLAKADNEFVREERVFIREIADRHNFPKDELEKLMQTENPIESLGALSSSKKEEYLIDSFHLIMADGKIEPQEVTFCQNIAVKLGYHKDIVMKVLNNWTTMSSIDFSAWKVT